MLDQIRDLILHIHMLLMIDTEDEALDLKKAVICEKPFTINANEAKLIQEKAKANNVFCMEDIWMRFVPLIKKLKNLL